MAMLNNQRIYKYFSKQYFAGDFHIWIDGCRFIVILIMAGNKSQKPGSIASFNDITVNLRFLYTCQQLQFLVG